MKKLTVLMMSAALMMGAVSTTFAADAMTKKDSMGHTSKDCMKKDGMGKDCMSKDKMSQDKMSQNDMSKDHMKKDTMKKDAMGQ